jgi:polysaccharide biosynthesis/export protein ExoF
MTLLSMLKSKSLIGVSVNIAFVVVLANALGTKAQVRSVGEDRTLKTPISQVEPPASPPASTMSAALRIGDRLKITFFEMLDMPEAGGQGGRGGAAAPSSLLTFYQRMDLSGDYTIDGDGAVSFPRLGRFQVEGRGIKDLQAELSAAFTKAMTRPADVNVTVLERSPVYVVGPVKSPGAYKHVPGMMVLHAVALAGGLDTARHGTTSQLIEGVREVERIQKASDQMKRLIARRARLEMERTGRSPLVMPPQLVSLAGAQAAQAIVASEMANLQVEQTRRQQQHSEVDAMAQAVRNEVAVLKRQLAQLDVHAQIRNERLNDLQNLLSRGLTSRNGLVTVRSELAEVEARRQQIMLAMVQTENRLTQASQARERLVSDHEASLLRTIAATDNEITELQPSLNSAETLMALIEERNAEILQARSAGEPDFEIVRQSKAGPTVIPAQETSSLVPGDVLKISTKQRTTSQPEATPFRKASVHISRGTVR